MIGYYNVYYDGQLMAQGVRAMSEFRCDRTGLYENRQCECVHGKGP